MLVSRSSSCGNSTSSSSDDLAITAATLPGSFPQGIDSSVSSLGKEKFSQPPSSRSLEGKKVLPGTSDLSISTNEKGFQISRKAFSFFEQLEEDISTLQEQINNEIIDEDTKPKVLQSLHKLIQTLPHIEEEKRTDVADSIIGLQVDLIEKTDLSLTESVESLYAFLNVNRHNSLTEDAKLTLQYFVSKILEKGNPLKEPDDSHLITLLRASYEIMSTHQLDPATLKVLEGKLPIYSNIQAIESWIKKSQMLGKSSHDRVKQKNWSEWWLFAKSLKKDSYSRQLFMAWTEAVRLHGTSPLIGEVFHSTSWTNLFALWKIFPEPQDTLYMTIFEACKNSLKKVRGKVNADEVVKLLNRHIELRYKIDAPPITSKLEQLELDLIKLVAPPIKALKPFCLIFQKRLEHSCPIEFKNMFHSFLTGKHTFSLEEKELLAQTAAKLRIYAGANKTLQSEEWLTYAEALGSLHFDKSNDEALLYTTHCYYLYKEANIKLRHLVPELIAKCSMQALHQFKTWLIHTWNVQTSAENPLLGAGWLEIIKREIPNVIDDPANVSTDELQYLINHLPYVCNHTGLKEFFSFWQSNVTSFLKKNPEEAVVHRSLLLQLASLLRSLASTHKIIEAEKWLIYAGFLSLLRCPEGDAETLLYQVEYRASPHSDGERWVKLITDSMLTNSDQAINKLEKYLKDKWDLSQSFQDQFLAKVWGKIIVRKLQDVTFTETQLDYLINHLPYLTRDAGALKTIESLWEKNFWSFLATSNGTEQEIYHKYYQIFRGIKSLIYDTSSDNFNLYYYPCGKDFPEDLNYSKIFDLVVQHVKLIYKPTDPIHNKYSEGLFYLQFAQMLAKKLDIHSKDELSTLNLLCHYLSIPSEAKTKIFHTLMRDRCIKGIDEVSNDSYFLKLVYLGQGYPDINNPAKIVELDPSQTSNTPFPKLQNETSDCEIYFELLNDLIDCDTSGALLHAARILSNKGNDFLRKYPSQYIACLKSIITRLKNMPYFSHDRMIAGGFLLESIMDTDSQKKFKLAITSPKFDSHQLLSTVESKTSLDYGDDEDEIRSAVKDVFTFLLEEDQNIDNNSNLKTTLQAIECQLVYFHKLNVYYNDDQALTTHLISLMSLLNKAFSSKNDFITKIFLDVGLYFMHFFNSLPPQPSLAVGKTKIDFTITQFSHKKITRKDLEDTLKEADNLATHNYMLLSTKEGKAYLESLNNLRSLVVGRALGSLVA